jgi:hypothetical protein
MKEKYPRYFDQYEQLQDEEYPGTKEFLASFPSDRLSRSNSSKSLKTGDQTRL